MDDERHDSKRKPRTQTVNFWVDLVTGLVFALMVGSGILQKWILPPGSRGGAGLTWLGEGRHFWGDIHFWAGIAMLALVVVHIWLHWNWVLGNWRRLIGALRSPLTWLYLALFLALIFTPLLIPRHYSEEYRQEHDQAEEESNRPMSETAEHSAAVDGVVHGDGSGQHAGAGRGRGSEAP